MKPEDQSDEELQRILAMKQREIPSPKFFQGLSGRITDRLHHPGPPPPPTLMQKLGLDFDTKPVLLCASGIVVCALLIYGIVSSRHVEVPAPTQEVAVEGIVPVNRPGASMAPTKPGARIATPEELPRSVDPAFAADPSALKNFGTQPKPVAVPAPAPPK